MAYTEKHRPRITYLTAGAGGMYCGSCIRDNELVAELQNEGWDITLLPLYTPIRTDNEDRSIDRVFFGGVNVYLQQKLPLLRHLPGVFDRFLDNPAFIRRVTAKNMSVDARELGALTLSMLKGEDGNQRREVAKLVKFLREHERPDLICLTNLLVGGSIPALKRELGIPILVTLQGDDVFLDELEEPWRAKVLEAMRNLAQQVDGFITFSAYYRDRMAGLLEVDPARFHLTPLGIDTDEFAPVFEKRRGRTPGNILGYFARICPEKGFDLAVEAFIELAGKSPDYRLLAGGWLSAKDRKFYDAQVERIESAGLGDRFEYIGAVDRAEKLRFFEKIDVFCVPARFIEPKGMYLLEAMACGIPAVAPDRGAFPEMIEKSGGGKLFKSEDMAGLVKSIEDVFANPEAFTGRDWTVGHANRQAMARETAVVFEKVLGGGDMEHRG